MSPADSPHCTVEDLHAAMRSWKTRDRVGSGLPLTITCRTEDNIKLHIARDLEFRQAGAVAIAPMQGFKNLSPKRVAARRKKNKAARKARRQHRRP